MDSLTTLIIRGISHIDRAAVAVNSSSGHGGGGPPAGGGGPQYSRDCYCGRRLAGLETGPIPNRGPDVSAGLWVLISLAGIHLALRVYLKMYRLKGLWWDDYILCLSFVSFVPFSFLSALYYTQYPLVLMAND